MAICSGVVAIPRRRPGKGKVRRQGGVDLGQEIEIDDTLQLHERLEVLAETLLVFIDSLQDGIIDESLWTELSKTISVQGSQPLSGDAKRSLVLDVLSASPVHSISFTFVTAMLARLVDEYDPLYRSRPSTPRSPKSPDLLLGDEMRSAEDRYAEIFANVMIKAPLPARGRDRRVNLDLRKEAIRVFMKSGWD
jgi:hypothetical protein